MNPNSPDKKKKIEVLEFFRGILDKETKPLYYEHLRGYISSASTPVKSYVKKNCKGNELLTFFKRRKNFFCVDRHDFVSLSEKKFKTSFVNDEKPVEPEQFLSSVRKKKHTGMYIVAGERISEQNEKPFESEFCNSDTKFPTKCSKCNKVILPTMSNDKFVNVFQCHCDKNQTVDKNLLSFSNEKGKCESSDNSERRNYDGIFEEEKYAELEQTSINYFQALIQQKGKLSFDELLKENIPQEVVKYIKLSCAGNDLSKFFVNHRNVFFVDEHGFSNISDLENNTAGRSNDNVSSDSEDNESFPTSLSVCDGPSSNPHSYTVDTTEAATVCYLIEIIQANPSFSLKNVFHFFCNAPEDVSSYICQKYRKKKLKKFLQSYPKIFIIKRNLEVSLCQGFHCHFDSLKEMCMRTSMQNAPYFEDNTISSNIETDNVLVKENSSSFSCIPLSKPDVTCALPKGELHEVEEYGVNGLPASQIKEETCNIPECDSKPSIQFSKGLRSRNPFQCTDELTTFVEKDVVHSNTQCVHGELTVLSKTYETPDVLQCDNEKVPTVAKKDEVSKVEKCSNYKLSAFSKHCKTLSNIQHNVGGLSTQHSILKNEHQKFLAVWTTELFCIQIHIKKKMLESDVENDAVDYFAEVLSKCNQKLMFYSSLIGTLGQAPPHVTAFINRYYQGNNLELFFLKHQEFFPLDNCVSLVKSRVPKVCSKQNLVKAIINNVLQIPHVYYTDEFCKLCFVNYSLLDRLVAFLKKKHKLPLSKVAGHLSQLTIVEKYFLKDFEGSTFPEKVKNYIRYFKFLFFIDKGFVELDNNSEKLLKDILDSIFAGKISTMINSGIRTITEFESVFGSVFCTSLMPQMEKFQSIFFKSFISEHKNYFKINGNEVSTVCHINMDLSVEIRTEVCKIVENELYEKQTVFYSELPSIISCIKPDLMDVLGKRRPVILLHILFFSDTFVCENGYVQLNSCVTESSDFENPLKQAKDFNHCENFNDILIGDDIFRHNSKPDIACFPNSIREIEKINKKYLLNVTLREDRENSNDSKSGHHVTSCLSYVPKTQEGKKEHISVKSNDPLKFTHVKLQSNDSVDTEAITDCKSEHYKINKFNPSIVDDVDNQFASNSSELFQPEKKLMNPNNAFGEIPCDMKNIKTKLKGLGGGIGTYHTFELPRISNELLCASLKELFNTKNDIMYSISDIVNRLLSCENCVVDKKTKHDEVAGSNCAVEIPVIAKELCKQIFLKLNLFDFRDNIKNAEFVPFQVHSSRFQEFTLARVKIVSSQMLDFLHDSDVVIKVRLFLVPLTDSKVKKHNFMCYFCVGKEGTDYRFSSLKSVYSFISDFPCFPASKQLCFYSLIESSYLNCEPTMIVNILLCSAYDVCPTKSIFNAKYNTILKQSEVFFNFCYRKFQKTVCLHSFFFFLFRKYRCKYSDLFLQTDTSLSDILLGFLQYCQEFLCSVQNYQKKEVQKQIAMKFSIYSGSNNAITGNSYFVLKSKSEMSNKITFAAEGKETLKASVDNDLKVSSNCENVDTIRKDFDALASGSEFVNSVFKTPGRLRENKEVLDCNLDNSHISHYEEIKGDVETSHSIDVDKSYLGSISLLTRDSGFICVTAFSLKYLVFFKKDMIHCNIHNSKDCFNKLRIGHKVSCNIHSFENAPKVLLATLVAPCCFENSGEVSYDAKKVHRQEYRKESFGLNNIYSSNESKRDISRFKQECIIKANDASIKQPENVEVTPEEAVTFSVKLSDSSGVKSHVCNKSTNGSFAFPRSKSAFLVPTDDASEEIRVKTREAGCQTLSTGQILTTSFACDI